MQKIIDIKDDCDNDALLYIVEQSNVACHTGKYSCFSEEKPFTLGELEQVLLQRKADKPEGSYTVKLLQDDSLVFEKIREETEEVIVAAKKEGKQRTIEESADVLYHLIVLLAKQEISVEEVLVELGKRRK